MGRIQRRRTDLRIQREQKLCPHGSITGAVFIPQDATRDSRAGAGRWAKRSHHGRVTHVAEWPFGRGMAVRRTDWGGDVGSGLVAFLRLASDMDRHSLLFGFATHGVKTVNDRVGIKLRHSTSRAV